MVYRTTRLGNGMPGGAIEYRGDLPAPVTTYAASLSDSNLAANLMVPAATNRTWAPVVCRVPRNRIKAFYVHGAETQPNALPYPGAAGVGEVNRSAFQDQLVLLTDWHINPGWYEAGYPRNLGLSTRVPQLVTQVTGGSGPGRSQPRPLFTRVQTVGRASATVKTYPTKGAKS